MHSSTGNLQNTHFTKLYHNREHQSSLYVICVWCLHSNRQTAWSMRTSLFRCRCCEMPTNERMECSRFHRNNRKVFSIPRAWMFLFCVAMHDFGIISFRVGAPSLLIFVPISILNEVAKMVMKCLFTKSGNHFDNIILIWKVFAKRDWPHFCEHIPDPGLKCRKRTHGGCELALENQIQKLNCQNANVIWDCIQSTNEEHSLNAQCFNASDPYLTRCRLLSI